MSERSYELKEAMSRLIVNQPFFAVVLLDLLTLVELPPNDQRIPTAATDSKNLYINTGFFKKLSIEERVGVLCHEVMHVILQHCPRMKLYQERGFGPDLKPFSGKKWNHATDYIINDWVHSSKAGKIPVGGLFHPDFTRKDLADDVYLKLPDDEDDGQDGNWDIHLPSAEDSPTTADVQRAVAGAANAAKNMGKLPAGMERLVKELTEPQVPWQDQLRLTVMKAAGRDMNTWQRPYRRRLAVPPHVYWPGRTGIGAGVIVSYEDTSGSVGEQEHAAMRTEEVSLFEDLRPEAMYIGSCDSRAYDPVEVQSVDDIISYKSKGGGGTHMPAIFDKLAEENINPDCLIILTDGYTDFGEPPPYEVVWVMTTDIVAPYGKTIRIRVGQ